MRDFPVRVHGTKDPVQAVQHIALTDAETGDVTGLIPPVRQRRRRAGLREAEKRRHGAPALRPRADGDHGVAVVEEGHLARRDREAEPRLPEGQAPLVPGAADQGDVAEAQALDLSELLEHDRAHRLAAELGVADVGAEAAGHDVCDAGLGGGSDDLALCVGRCGHGEGDDEELLAPKRLDQGFWFVEVYFDVFDSLGQDAFGLGSCQGRDGVLSGFEKGREQKLPDMT